MSPVLGACRRVAAAVVLVLLAAACGGATGDRATPEGGGRATVGAASVRVGGDLVAGPRFEIAPVALTEIWVDPEHGDDARDGASRQEALRTITAAWERIPAGEDLTVGYRIALVAGTYVAEDAPNYWEARHGTATAPIVLESVDGPGRAALPPINAFDVRHFYVLGVAITSEFDPFHCERCDHLLLREVTLAGVPDGRSGDRPQETLKVNQSSNVFVEDSVISGATDNAVDFVAVQHGHLTGNRIGGADDWCAYVKGGSALLTVEGNEFADCGTGGFTAGQGTGFQFMEPPWLTYEASNIRVINNIVHDVDGAAFGVAGASDTLIAYNTAYRIGARSHLIEVVLGRRGCDGAPDDADAVAACRAQLVRGGWGTTGEELEIIPNRNVWFYDNVLINPSDFPTPDVHFQVHGCVDARTSETNIPGPACAADGLVLAGNVILNGAEDVALFDEVAGCGGAGSSCAAAQLRGDNTINVAGLALIDPEAGDYCVGRVPVGVTAVAIPDFPRDGSGARSSGASAAMLSNAVTTNLRGEPRPAQGGRPGAC